MQIGRGIITVITDQQAACVSAPSNRPRLTSMPPALGLGHEALIPNPGNGPEDVRLMFPPRAMNLGSEAHVLTPCLTILPIYMPYFSVYKTLFFGKIIRLKIDRHLIQESQLRRERHGCLAAHTLSKRFPPITILIVTDIS